MFQIFQTQPIVTAAMIVCMIFSMLMRGMLGVMYHRMILETDNMATTDNKLLKQCKLKFENCYRLNSGVSNVSVFVDKFLSRMNIGIFSFDMINHLTGQTMLFSVVIAGVGIIRSILSGATVGQVIPFYIVSFLGLYVYFSLSSLIDIAGKKRNLKIHLVDYLENHLSARIDTTKRDMDMLYGEGSPFDGAQGQSESEATVKLLQDSGREKFLASQVLITDEELQALLEEFC